MWEGRVCSGRSGRRVFLMTSAVLVDVLRLVEAVCRGWLPECSCSEGGRPVGGVPGEGSSDGCGYWVRVGRVVAGGWVMLDWRERWGWWAFGSR